MRLDSEANMIWDTINLTCAAAGVKNKMKSNRIVVVE